MTTDIVASARAMARLRPVRIGALVDAWIARGVYRRQIRQLAQLDDHVLRDIGVTRDSVRALRL
jgi:uncharacterized protein YjiS (DUF1127 family)